MITILIFAIVGFVWFFIENRKEQYLGWFDVIWFSCFGSLIGGVVGLIISIFLPCDIQTKTERYNLASIQDNSVVHGSFFIGSGSVDGVFKYSFYVENDGFFTLNSVPANMAVITYSNSTPVLKVHEKIAPLSSWKNWFSLAKLRGKVGGKQYVFEVPKGSIVNSFNLDAQ